jgi:hypothetical protein
MVREPNLNLDEIRQALENTSGYPYELQIVRRVERYRPYGYVVQPNYSFEDHDTGEARELDFHALEAVPISMQRSEYAFIVILGACKDNKNPYVFFTRRMPFSGMTLNSEVPIAGCPMEICEENSENEAIEWYLRLHEFLHIAKMDIVSSQFCEVRKKSAKWEVQSQPIFKDIYIPLIKALSREIEEHNKACAPDKDEPLPTYFICYPLLVLRGPLLEYYVPPEGDAQLRDAKHILVIKHYESRTVKGQYAIDVIHESYLEQYLDLIEQEVSTFVNRIRRNKAKIIRSIQKLAKTEDTKS